MIVLHQARPWMIKAVCGWFRSEGTEGNLHNVEEMRYMA